MGTLVKIFHLNARTPAIISSPWKIDHKRPLNQSQADLSQSWDAVLLTREGYSLCVRKISFKSYCHYRVLLFAFREYTKGKGVNVVAAENNVYHFKLFELFNRCRRDKKKRLWNHIVSSWGNQNVYAACVELVPCASSSISKCTKESTLLSMHKP